MNSAPIVPAALAFDAQGLQTAARSQARDDFLAGNELPQRWRGRDRFVVLDTGFGPGANFLATWQAWRNDAQRCTRLVFISIEQHPLSGDALTEFHRASPLPMLAAELQRAWPPPTHNLHRLNFDDGAVELLLAFGAVQDWLPELVAEIDAFFLGGCASGDHPQTWDARFCKAIGRLAAPGATLASRSAPHALRAHLASAGFNVQPAHDEVGRHDITLAHFAPTFTPRRAVARSRSTASNDRHALIIGAGLAGCAAASALAGHGWRSTVLERQALIASGASGNLGGLFHGIVNAQDGVHARFNRAAALSAHGAVKSALARGVAGNAN
ncbi:MAG: FAD-dependent oxidoreductase, partial [Rhizobiales bacterium]|nr:FAD-dependent oxidoreductase [Rhizobacter sp.]